MEIHRSCGHIMTTGFTCGAYALRESDLCYWHHKASQSRSERRNRLKQQPEPPTGIVLPLLEDANSVQLAIQMIAQAIADRRIARSEAGALLYSCQLAMTNLKNVVPPNRISVWSTNVIPEGTNEGHDVVEAPEIPIEDDPAYAEKDEDEDDTDDCDDADREEDNAPISTPSDSDEQWKEVFALFRKDLKSIQRLGYLKDVTEDQLTG
jgi:hypothetical protein